MSDHALFFPPLHRLASRTSSAHSQVAAATFAPTSTTIAPTSACRTYSNTRVAAAEPAPCPRRRRRSRPRHRRTALRRPPARRRLPQLPRSRQFLRLRCHFLHQLQRLRLLNSTPGSKSPGKKQTERAPAAPVAARPADGRPVPQPQQQQQCRPPAAACALLALITRVLILLAMNHNEA